jgi:DNA-directed RNA polymerase subunit RPC12/RpoP
VTYERRRKPRWEVYQQEISRRMESRTAVTGFGGGSCACNLLGRNYREETRMTWICVWCGRENHQEDRIALQDPTCMRCGMKRANSKQVQEQIEVKLLQTRREIATTGDTIKHHQEFLWLLENRLQEIYEEMEPHKREIESARKYLNEQKSELEKLEAVEIHTTPVKYIAPTQTRLIRQGVKG